MSNPSHALKESHHDKPGVPNSVVKHIHTLCKVKSISFPQDYPLDSDQMVYIENLLPRYKIRNSNHYNISKIMQYLINNSGKNVTEVEEDSSGYDSEDIAIDVYLNEQKPPFKDDEDEIPCHDDRNQQLYHYFKDMLHYLKLSKKFELAEEIVRTNDIIKECKSLINTKKHALLLKIRKDIAAYIQEYISSGVVQSLEKIKEDVVDNNYE